MARGERDDVTGVETTGHEWDGIKELNNPLPRWWLLVLYACILYALVYTIFYPAWPTLSGYTKGLLGYNSRAEYYQEAAKAAAGQEQFTQRIAALGITEISADPQLLEFSLAGGRAVFNENCAACHGVGGQGRPTFPVLADDKWLWGGSLAELEQTIRHGVRSADDDATRQSVMPRFGADAILEPAAIDDVANYVLSLNGSEVDAQSLDRGAKVFAENCVACHGEKAEGKKEFGAPALNDNIWQFVSDPKSLVSQISLPRHGVMPAWTKRLSDDRIKMVAIYVHSLGGGQ